MGRPGSGLAGGFFDKRSHAGLQLDALDGARGVAVLLVVLSHASNEGRHLHPSLDFSGAGKYGVYLFFVLSAFLLTLPITSRSGSQLARPAPHVAYLMRRVLRVFPLYVLALTVGLLATRMLATWAIPLTTEEWIAHLLLREGKSIYWTIPVEFKYYLVLPFVAVADLVLSGQRRPWLGAAVAFVLAVGVAVWVEPSAHPIQNAIRLLDYLPAFLCGSAAAFVFRALGGQPLRGPGRGVALEFAALSAAAAVLAVIPSFFAVWSGREVEPWAFHADVLMFGILWAVFVLGALLGAGGVRRVLAWAPLRFVGIVSFSVYLWHLVVLERVLGLVAAPAPAQVVLVLGLTLVVSAVSFWLVERPFIRSAWSRRLVARGAELPGRLWPRGGAA